MDPPGGGGGEGVGGGGGDDGVKNIRFAAQEPYLLECSK